MLHNQKEPVKRGFKSSFPQYNNTNETQYLNQLLKSLLIVREQTKANSLHVERKRREREREREREKEREREREKNMCIECISPLIAFSYFFLTVSWQGRWVSESEACQEYQLREPG